MAGVKGITVKVIRIMIAHRVRLLQRTRYGNIEFICFFPLEI